MLLIPYQYIDENKPYVNEASIKKAGIISRSRKIYIIKRFTPKIIEHSIFSNYRMNNVLLINKSKSKDENGVVTYIKTTYSFTYSSKIDEDISSFQDARLYLQYAITSGYEEYNDGYTDLGFTFGYEENDDPIEINLNDMMCDESEITNNQSLFIPSPYYYTAKQYELDHGYICEPIMTKNRYYTGRDLVDDKTSFYVVNETKDDIIKGIKCGNNKGMMIPVTNETRIFETYEKIKDADTIPFDMFMINSKSCFSSYKYIYDSQLRYNIRDIYTDNGLLVTRRKDYIDLIAQRLNTYCDNLTKIYGNIRVHYYSSDIFDKVDIIFDNEQNDKMISVALDRNSTFERMMVFLTDKYESYLNRAHIPNYDEYYSYA